MQGIQKNLASDYDYEFLVNGLWSSDICMTSSTPHIFHCIVFSTPRLPKMTLNLFWSLHPNHLLTTLPHLLFSCNSLYSTSLSYFHFHFLRFQLCCLSSAFTFEFNLVVLLPLSLSAISTLLSFFHFHFQNVHLPQGWFSTPAHQTSAVQITFCNAGGDLWQPPPSLPGACDGFKFSSVKHVCNRHMH